jgi:uncharacterized protein YlbG (UPF0298 family)
MTDFEDGEEIYLYKSCEKPNACAIGNVFYKNKQGQYNLINVNEIEVIEIIEDWK